MTSSPQTCTWFSGNCPSSNRQVIVFLKWQSDTALPSMFPTLRNVLPLFILFLCFPPFYFTLPEHKKLPWRSHSKILSSWNAGQNHSLLLHAKWCTESSTVCSHLFPPSSRGKKNYAFYLFIFSNSLYSATHYPASLSTWVLPLASHLSTCLSLLCAPTIYTQCLGSY